MASTRIKEVFKKYGKVGFGVHMSISAATTAALYAAIKSNVDIESLFDKFGLQSLSNKNNNNTNNNNNNNNNNDSNPSVEIEKKRNRTAELAVSSGGALALALLCNKVLFPVRVPITLVVTPALARFLARRQIIKSVV